MSGDNKKNKKEKTSHTGDETFQSPITKQDEKKAMKHKHESEEPEFIEKLPPKLKKVMETFMSMDISRSSLSPFDSKINEKHIDKILEIKEKYEDKIFKDTQQSRKFQLVYVLIGVSVFVFLTLLLVGKDTELFKEIIKIVVLFAGGLGTGYGIKTYKDKK